MYAIILLQKILPLFIFFKLPTKDFYFYLTLIYTAILKKTFLPNCERLLHNSFNLFLKIAQQVFYCNLVLLCLYNFAKTCRHKYVCTSHPISDNFLRLSRKPFQLKENYCFCELIKKNVWIIWPSRRHNIVACC